ncbi:MAG: hypothetical protein ACOYN3_04110, partial [Acidimicrobiia bacterium]
DPLEDCLTRVRRAPGRRTAAVRDVLERMRQMPERSALAQRVDAVVRAAGLPALTWNVHLSNGQQHWRAPLAYPGARAVIECRGWPSDPSSVLLPESLLGNTGWRVVGITWTMSDAEIVAAVGAGLLRR